MLAIPRITLLANEVRQCIKLFHSMLKYVFICAIKKFDLQFSDSKSVQALQQRC